MLVQSVDILNVSILKSFPPQLQIEASGWANTGGWTNIRLEAAPTIDPGRTWAFNLVGDPPTGMAAQVMTKVSASTTLEVIGNMPTTIQVNTGSNSVSVPVSQSLSDGMNLNSPPAGFREEHGVAEYRAVRIGAEIFVRCSGTLPNQNDYADIVRCRGGYGHRNLAFSDTPRRPRYPRCANSDLLRASCFQPMSRR